MKTLSDIPVMLSPPWNRRVPPGLTPQVAVLGEDITVASVGHAFVQVPASLLDPESKPTYLVTDFLVDQSQSTGGGGAQQDPVQMDLTQSPGYNFNVLAPAGKHFSVKLPAGVPAAYFSAFLGRQEINAPSGILTAVNGQIDFQNLTDANPPDYSYTSFALNKAGNVALIVEMEGQTHSNLQFDGILFAMTFPTTASNGPKWYSPQSYSVPLGTKSIYPRAETFLTFSYQTASSKDPGRFVVID